MTEIGEKGIVKKPAYDTILPPRKNGLFVVHWQIHDVCSLDFDGFLPNRSTMEPFSRQTVQPSGPSTSHAGGGCSFGVRLNLQQPFAA